MLITGEIFDFLMDDFAVLKAEYENSTCPAFGIFHNISPAGLLRQIHLFSSFNLFINKHVFISGFTSFLKEEFAPKFQTKVRI
jgi:hypothetical protein